ncbi:MAG TPA: potassium uptake protein TrkH, partial [Oceanicaulis sp.]|nr:potassium uptake protein TrkH [Oceanicaulis sp.]
ELGGPPEHPDALRLALFNAVSVLTTTGYAAGDYQLWGPLAMATIFFLTFLGGCAGSTAGGFKVFRIQIMLKSTWASLQ